jgi:hypothetical protein
MTRRSSPATTSAAKPHAAQITLSVVLLQLLRELNKRARTLSGNLDLDADVFAEPVDQRQGLVDVLDFLDLHARVLVVLFERAATEV